MAKTPFLGTCFVRVKHRPPEKCALGNSVSGDTFCLHPSASTRATCAKHKRQYQTGLQLSEKTGKGSPRHRYDRYEAARYLLRTGKS
jgi:hypothetical protein